MTFLNPLVLFALAAAAIPIILHLFHLRKLRTIDFSTLEFLKELQQTKIRRLKIRQLLLLILRTLLILLIVLAFARPTIKGNLIGTKAQALTTAVLLVDDSYSMAASDADGEYFKQAKEAAIGIVNLMGEGDEVFLLPLSGVSNDAPEPAAYRDMAVVRSIVRDLGVTFIHRRLEDGLLLAGRILSRSRNYNKEVYVLSDFQEGVVGQRMKPTEENGQVFPPDVRIYLLPIGKRDLQNLGITSASIPNGIIETGKAFQLKLSVGNFSSSDARNHLLSVFLNGTRVAQKGLDIAGGQIVQSEFSLTPKKAGFLDGMIELEDDDLIQDNRFYFSLRLPERISVLLVGSEQDTRYLALALGTRVEASSPLKIERVAHELVTARALENRDVVILANPGQQSSAIVERLAAFVAKGGGLLVFPGPQSTPAVFNRMYAPMNLPVLQSVETIGEVSETTGFVQIEKTELQHPLFEGMFENARERISGQERRSLESPNIRTLARFLPSATATSIIALSNGVPFLLEQKNGEGRILTACLPATLEWSDFPLKGLFVPLMHRSISYLTQEAVRQAQVVAGDPVRVNLPKDPGSTPVVQTPQGIDAAIAPVTQAGARTALFSETGQPGTYVVREQQVPITKFSVNLDPDESKTGRAGKESIEALTGRFGLASRSVITIEQPVGVERIVSQSRLGEELWKYFLIAALVIALAEMAVSRDSVPDTGVAAA